LGGREGEKRNEGRLKTGGESFWDGRGHKVRGKDSTTLKLLSPPSKIKEVKT